MPPLIRRKVILEFGKIVGGDHIITDSNIIRDAETSTYKTNQKITAIIKPANSVQVQKIVNAARRHKTPIYVFSTGKNWGYGSRIPKKSHSFLIDLGRINKILDFNNELGYVTVEPGVTQKQLHNFLKKNKAKFSMSTTGSAPDTSIIGNICERGVGVGPYGFRAHYISDLEILLPSGKFIHTGFGKFENAKSAKSYPEGIGPSFNDIFLQSNFGIITKLTMFLVPTPNYSQVIYISIAKDKDLPKYIELLRTYNFFSSAKKRISFRNDLQYLPPHAQYPWEASKNKTPLPKNVAQQLKKKYDINFAWKATAVIYGYTVEEVGAQISYFKLLLKKLDNVTISPIYSENTMANEPRNLGGSLYWRMKTKPPKIKDPDTDGCGLIRLSIAVPFVAKNIFEVIKAMRTIITQLSYEPFIEAHCISERTLVVIATIIFDRTVHGEDENALICHDTLLNKLMEMGYYPYRDNGRAVSRFPKSSDSYDEFQKSIKLALDENNILAPGRYE